MSVVKCCGARWDSRIKKCPQCGELFKNKTTEKCPECGGDGYKVVLLTRPAHHPACDGSCRNCPVPEQYEAQEPCEVCQTTGKIPVKPTKEIWINEKV